MESELDRVLDLLRDAVAHQRQDLNPAFEDFDIWGWALSELTVMIGMIGRHRLAFVPVAGATVSPDAVRVRYDKKLVQNAPTIDTDGELAAAEEPEVFTHYQLPYTPGAAGERRFARR